MDYETITLLDYFRETFSQKKLCKLTLLKYQTGEFSRDYFYTIKNKIYTNKLSDDELEKIIL